MHGSTQMDIPRDILALSMIATFSIPLHFLSGLYCIPSDILKLKWTTCLLNNFQNNSQQDSCNLTGFQPSSKSVLSTVARRSDGYRNCLNVINSGSVCSILSERTIRLFPALKKNVKLTDWVSCSGISLRTGNNSVVLETVLSTPNLFICKLCQFHSSN